MADQPNIFATLLPTPENVADLREAKFREDAKGQDFWQHASGLTGLDFRKDMVSRGIGMAPEDKRAFQTQQIMGRSQQMLAELVKNGDMDPLDAQEQVISSAMSDFMSLGDYQAAQGLLPGLNQIRTYRSELDKLRSESQENRATAFNQQASGESTLAKTPSEIYKNQAAGQESIQKGGAAVLTAQGSYAADMAHADWWNRADPNIRSKAGGTGSEFKLPGAEQTKIRAQGTGVLNLFDAMGDLSTFMEKAPIVASATAQGANVGSQYLAGLNSIFSNKGASVGGFDALSTRPEDGTDGMSPKQIVFQNRDQIRKAALKLGFKDITAFQSLVIDAAYSLARANDPGGRLSNNDFQFALDSLGAVQDAKSAKKAFKALAERGYTKYQNMKRVIPKDTWNDLFGDMDKEVDASYAQFTGEHGTSDIANVQDEERRKALRDKYTKPSK